MGHEVPEAEGLGTRSRGRGPGRWALDQRRGGDVAFDERDAALVGGTNAPELSQSFARRADLKLLRLKGSGRAASGGAVLTSR